MEVLQKELNHQSHQHVFSLPCHIAGLWENHQYNEWLYPNIPFADYLWILLPICFDDDHWVLLAANTATKCVGVLNSLPGYSKAEKRYCSHFINYMSARAREVPLTPSRWTVKLYTNSCQVDTHSCGVFVLMFAEQLLKGISPCVLRQCHVRAFRMYVRARFVSFS